MTLSGDQEDETITCLSLGDVNIWLAYDVPQKNRRRLLSATK